MLTNIKHIVMYKNSRHYEIRISPITSGNTPIRAQKTPAECYFSGSTACRVTSS